jgi:uncharacterized protein (TIGR03067 family)
MRTQWLPCAAVTVLIAAGPAQDDRAKQEAQRLRGSWVWVNIGAGLTDQAANERIKSGRVVTVFDGDAMIVKDDGKERQRATYRLDPGKNPKEIDVTITQGTQTLLLKGIYLLEGDDLKLCLGAPGADRPTEFIAKPGSQTGLWVLKREKRGP